MSQIMNPEVRRPLVVECMMADPPLTARITYTDVKGETKERHIEPYEVKAGELFGFCLRDGHIKRFKVDRITKVVPDHPFKPRSPIQIPC